MHALVLGSFIAACGAAQKAGDGEGGGGGGEGGGGGGEGGGGGGAKPTVTTPATLDEQLVMGARLYEDECAGCHGSDGAGRKSAPAIMGPNALPEIPPAGALRRTVPFKTVKDVLDWTAVSMPSNEPGSLAPAEYDAIVAHQLSVLGIDLKGQPLTAERAGGLLLR